jgi:dipeptidyl-peptidase 4
MRKSGNFTLRLVAIVLLCFTGNNLLFSQFAPADKRPRVTAWADDVHFLFQNYDAEGKPVLEKVNVLTGKKQIVAIEKTPREKMEEALPNGTKLSRNDILSPDEKSVILIKDDDLYYFQIGGKELVRLTSDPEPEINARFSPDGKKIAYTKNKDLYVYDLDSKREIRLTHDATDKIYNGWSSWVYMEEILGRASRYAAFWWSPDGSKLAFFRFDDNPVPVFTLNRLDQADGLHGKIEATPYPKPGDPNPIVRIGIADIATAKKTWVKTDDTIDQYFAWPFWTPDSKKLAIQVLNRDQNDLRIILADAQTGEHTQIYRENRKTWVDFFEDVYVMKNGSGFILRSYRNDWENLYHHAWDGKLIAQLTNFKWRVRTIRKVDEEAKTIYFSGTGSESTDNHFFWASLDGKKQGQITSGNGSHDVLISPKGNYFIDTWNSLVSPGSIVAIDKKGKVVREIHKFEQPVFDPSKQSKNELHKISTSDGLFQIPFIISYPLNFDANKKYPVVFTIYGGPNAQGVHNRYRATPSWYAENSIITVTADHRGSGHFGKKGLDYLHRSLGKWEILDYADMVKWLRTKPYIDAGKMGITGGSYGGYLTCLALTKGADYWTHGVASASVTDWALYDNVYTERYMDTPQDNPEGYKEGSVLNYVAQYKGKLQITHGDMDDNVHMQNSIQLISKLQDAGKSFEFMIYPGGRHGWGGAKRSHSTEMANRFWLGGFFGK